jgi:hypothetical protein
MMMKSLFFKSILVINLVIFIFPLFTFAQDVTNVTIGGEPSADPGEATVVNVTPNPSGSGRPSSGSYTNISDMPFTCDSLASCLRGIFVMGVTIASILAVVMMIVGGIEYMGTDSIFKKSQSKERITYALGGLLIALVSVLILTTIFGGEGGDFIINLDF